MSKAVDRSQVLRTTRVRTALKNDASWIHKSRDDEAEEDKAGTDHTERRFPLRKKSYVLSAAQKFGSIDSSVSPPLQKTEVAPSEGDSTNHSNGGTVPPHKASEPEGSTVETGADIKPQVTAEEPVSNGDAHPESNVEIRGENGETAGEKSSVEHRDVNAEAPADAPVEDCVQTVSSVQENAEAVPPVESPEQPLAKTESQNLEEPPADPSNTGHSEVNVTADANVDDSSGGRVESNGITEINDVPKSQEDSGDVAEGESCSKSPAEQVTEEIIAASPEVTVESSTETTHVKSTTTEEQSTVVTSVESVPDIVESASSSLPESEIIAKDSCSQAEAEGGEENVAAASEVVVDSSPAVSETTQEEGAAPHNAVQTVPDILSEPSALPDAGTAAEDSSDIHRAEPVTVATIEAADEVVLESSPTAAAVINSTQEEAGAPHIDVQTVPDLVPEPAALSAAENISEEHPTGPAAEEVVEAAAEVVVESSPVISVNETTQEEEAASHDAVAEPPAPPDAAADIKSAECEVESAAQTEPAFKATTEEVVEREVHSVVEQSIDPTPESAVVAELDINHALEPADASEAEAVQEKVVDQTIKLTDALDVEIPETKTAPEPTPSEEPQPSQQCNGTITSEGAEKPAEELSSTTTQITYRYTKGICSFCDQKIDGNVKISLSEPLVECHPECLKCATCALALGDLLKPMFLRGQVIQCGGCVAGALTM
ncbi:unnamed protein product [Ophioblennius macclurei]